MAWPLSSHLGLYKDFYCYLPVPRTIRYCVHHCEFLDFVHSFGGEFMTSNSKRYLGYKPIALKR